MCAVEVAVLYSAPTSRMYLFRSSGFGGVNNGWEGVEHTLRDEGGLNGKATNNIKTSVELICRHGIKIPLRCW